MGISGSRPEPQDPPLSGVEPAVVLHRAAVRRLAACGCTPGRGNGFHEAKLSEVTWKRLPLRRRLRSRRETPVTARGRCKAAGAVSEPVGQTTPGEARRQAPEAALHPCAGGARARAAETRSDTACRPSARGRAPSRVHFPASAGVSFTG